MTSSSDSESSATGARLSISVCSDIVMMIRSQPPSDLDNPADDLLRAIENLISQGNHYGTLGRTYRYQRKLIEAAREFRRAADHYARASDLLGEDSIQDNPEVPRARREAQLHCGRAWLELALAKVGMDYYAESLEAFENAIDIFDQLGREGDRLSMARCGEVWFNVGILHQRAEEWKDAEHAFGKSVALLTPLTDNQDAQVVCGKAWTCLAGVLEKVKRYGDAAENYQNAAEVFGQLLPTNDPAARFACGKAWLARGIALAKLERWADAAVAEAVNKSIRMFRAGKNDPPAYIMQAKCLRMLGYIEEIGHDRLSPAIRIWQETRHLYREHHQHADVTSRVEHLVILAKLAWGTRAAGQADRTMLCELREEGEEVLGQLLGLERSELAPHWLGIHFYCMNHPSFEITHAEGAVEALNMLKEVVESSGDHGEGLRAETVCSWFAPVKNDCLECHAFQNEWARRLLQKADDPLERNCADALRAKLVLEGLVPAFTQYGLFDFTYRPPDSPVTGDVPFGGEEYLFEKLFQPAWKRLSGPQGDALRRLQLLHWVLVALAAIGDDATASTKAAVRGYVLRIRNDYIDKDEKLSWSERLQLTSLALGVAEAEPQDYLDLAEQMREHMGKDEHERPLILRDVRMYRHVCGEFLRALERFRKSAEKVPETMLTRLEDSLVMFLSWTKDVDLAVSLPKEQDQEPAHKAVRGGLTARARRILFGDPKATPDMGADGMAIGEALDRLDADAVVDLSFDGRDQLWVTTWRRPQSGERARPALQRFKNDVTLRQWRDCWDRWETARQALWALEVDKDSLKNHPAWKAALQEALGAFWEQQNDPEQRRAFLRGRLKQAETPIRALLKKVIPEDLHISGEQERDARPIVLCPPSQVDYPSMAWHVARSVKRVPIFVPNVALLRGVEADCELRSEAATIWFYNPAEGDLKETSLARRREQWRTEPSCRRLEVLKVLDEVDGQASDTEPDIVDIYAHHLAGGMLSPFLPDGHSASSTHQDHTRLERWKARPRRLAVLWACKAGARDYEPDDLRSCWPIRCLLSRGTGYVLAPSRALLSLVSDAPKDQDPATYAFERLYVHLKRDGSVPSSYAAWMRDLLDRFKDDPTQLDDLGDLSLWVGRSVEAS